MHMPRMTVKPACVSPNEEETWYDKELANIQRQLSRDDAKKVVAIGFATGEFFIGDSCSEVRRAFQAKFPRGAADIRSRRRFTRDDGAVGSALNCSSNVR